MSILREHNGPIHRLLGGAALLCGIAVLGGCGSSVSTQVAAQQGRTTPNESNADVQQQSSKGAPGTGKVRVGKVFEKGRATPSTSKDDLTGGHSSSTGLNPCKLVTLSEAQAITGGAVTSQLEAPLGPTCIYRGASSLREITLTIESMSSSQLSRHMLKPQQVTVGGHHGYCGRLGSQMLFLPVGANHVLQVNAPCSIAQQFAARALTRTSA